MRQMTFFLFSRGKYKGKKNYLPLSRGLFLAIPAILPKQYLIDLILYQEFLNHKNEYLQSAWRNLTLKSVIKIQRFSGITVSVKILANKLRFAWNLTWGSETPYNHYFMIFGDVRDRIGIARDFFVQIIKFYRQHLIRSNGPMSSYSNANFRFQKC